MGLVLRGGGKALCILFECIAGACMRVQTVLHNVTIEV